MAFVVLENTIVYKKDGKVLAEVAYPPVGIGVVDICRTHVDETLRGQGMAGQLMERAAGELRKTRRKAVLTCSYAQRWFAEHPEQADVIKN
ncbi:MAG: N-acetyltransferase [Clostridiales bacterium]|nr:N-acetyltransferase [Clostridiales bacterium]